MSLFSAIDISATGIKAMQTWINVDAGNIANADDTVATTSPAYAEQSPVFAAIPGDGVDEPGDGVSTQVSLGSTAGITESDPDSPFANNQGEVKVANVQLSDQLVGLMQAQDNYQGNTEAISRAMAAYQAGLTIGS